MWLICCIKDGIRWKLLWPSCPLNVASGKVGFKSINKILMSSSISIIFPEECGLAFEVGITPWITIDDDLLNIRWPFPKIINSSSASRRTCLNQWIIAPRSIVSQLQIHLRGCCFLGVKINFFFEDLPLASSCIELVSS